MKIEHLAMWVKDLEGMRSFYEKYFGAKSNTLYHNEKKAFKSYFLSFENGPRLELMQTPSIPDDTSEVEKQRMGLIHFAVSTGSEKKVDSLTERLRTDGFRVIGEARWTGDGYYESIVLDPEENRIEITV